MRTHQHDPHRTIATLACLLAAALFLAACASQDNPPGTDEGTAASETTGTTASVTTGSEAAAANDSTSAAAVDNPDASVTAEALESDHPTRYTVREGDTLWDIADRFLRDPWVWPEIWNVNPEITNPHLIFPGDVIRLTWDDDTPQLEVERPVAEEPPVAEERPGVRRLEPEIRRLPLEEAIPTIPAEAIRSFLNRPRVVTPQQMDEAPYLLAARDDRVLMSRGDEVFARGIDPDAFGHYMVYRMGDPLIDPGTGETLAWEAIETGQARVIEHGDPARVRITANEREIREGDRLLPIDDVVSPTRYIPQVPEDDVEGHIIGLFDAISQVARNQIVVINKGAADGMQTGVVLGIDRATRTIEDPYSDPPGEEVELPPERIGSLMVFRPFDRVSYALIMSTTRTVGMHDRVVTP